MATRVKTIRYALPTYTGTISDAVEQSLGTASIYIPENSISTPITIKSCYIEIGWQDVCTVAGTIDEHRVGFVLGTASQSNFIETDNITNSGENMGGVIGPIDFTTYASSNIGTDSMIVYEVLIYMDWNTGTTLGANNISALVTLTYEYDDTVTTHIKTVQIPLESPNDYLSTTPGTEIGTNQIPQLDTILPESDVVIRDYFFILEGNQSNVGTNDITLSMQIASGATHSTGVQERALTSDIFTRYIWNLTDDYPVTSSAHAFKLWSDVSNSYPGITITLFITYEFTPSTSTRYLNSIYIPIELSSPLGYDTLPSCVDRTFFLQEPGTLTLRQSGLRFNFNVNAPLIAPGVRMKVGNQSYRSYTNNGNANCGMWSYQQRIDSGSDVGSAFTSFVRGRQTLTFTSYHSDTVDDPTNLNGYYILNYESDIATDGVGSHTHTIFNMMYEWDALLNDRMFTDNYSLDIPETYYWINAIGVIIIVWDSVDANAFTMDVEVKAGESKGAGFEELYADAVLCDAERRCSIVWMRGRDVFHRYPNDPEESRLDPEVQRQYRFFTPSVSSQGVIYFATYHSIYYSLDGVCTNYSGDGSNIPIKVMRSYDNSKALELTTSIGGSFSAVWYDNSEDIYLTAYQDSAHAGRSQNNKVS